MPRALVLSEHDLDEYRQRFARGEVSSALPYGVEALEQHGFTLTGAPAARGRLGTKVRDVVEHRSGLVVDRPLRGVRRAASADVVLALLEPQGWLASLLKRAHVPPYAGRPLVIWSCWLADDVRRADSATRERLRKRVAAADLVTHMAEGETEVLVDLGIPEERLLTIPFGVAHRYFTPGDEERDVDVLAVGQDRGRDYRTLFDAVRGTDLVVNLVCKRENLAGLDVPDNVRVHGTVPIPEYRALLRRAKVVAVPTHDLAYPTGQSVALEAAATGACVAVTGTTAMRGYFHDDVDAALIDVGDDAGWRTTLTDLLADPERRGRLGRAALASVTSTYNSEHMWAVVAEGMRARGIT